MNTCYSKAGDENDRRYFSEHVTMILSEPSGLANAELATPYIALQRFAYYAVANHALARSAVRALTGSAVRGSAHRRFTWKAIRDLTELVFGKGIHETQWLIAHVVGDMFGIRRNPHRVTWCQRIGRAIDHHFSCT
ncbi:MAG: hypothetical protein RLZZ332_1600 [Actinomycetota bacterium]